MEKTNKCRLCNELFIVSSATKEQFYCSRSCCNTFRKLKVQIAKVMFERKEFSLNDCIKHLHKHIDNYNIFNIYTSANSYLKSIEYKRETKFVKFGQQQRFGLISEDEILAAMEKRSTRS